MSEYVVPPWSTVEEQQEAFRCEDLVQSLAADPGAQMVVVLCAECSESTGHDRTVAEIRDTSEGALFMAHAELGELADIAVQDKDTAGRRIRAPWSNVNVLLEVKPDQRPRRPNSAPSTATAKCSKHGSIPLDERALMKAVNRYRRTGKRVRTAQRSNGALH